MTRLIAIAAASIGFALCLATAGTGIYWGVVLKGADPTWKAIHLDCAVACVTVSLVAHGLSIHLLRKHKS
jgi:hypothetical protein